MYVCTVMYKYMKSLRNDVHTLSDNTHVRSKLICECYNVIIYIANEERHIIIVIISVYTVRLTSFYFRP